MDKAELASFLEAEFPQVRGEFGIDDVAEEALLVRLHVQDKHLRPGGTVSGPAMFSLADVGMYLAVLARIGPQALTVTTNLSIDFMRKPEAGKDLIARAEVLKLGRSLAVGEVRICSEGSDKVVARAGVTYSIPPNVRA